MVDPVHGGLVDGKKMDPEAPCWFQSICEEDVYKVCGEVTKILLFSYLRRIIEFLSMKIGICNDHAGVEYKFKLMKMLQKRGIEVVNFGTDTEESVDYPIYAYKVAKAVTSGECELGILCCGTGIGISMAANKVRGIRAAVVNNAFGAEMTRRHNHANILCMGGRVISEEDAVRFTDIFLNTPEEGGRHDNRVAMITAIEDGTFEE